MLLRLNRKPSLQKIHVQSTQTSVNSLNGPQIMTNDAEQKTQFIREAQKFLQNDISSFLDPNEAQHQGQLFEFGNEMIDIAQQIVQSSCDLTAN